LIDVFQFPLYDNINIIYIYEYIYIYDLIYIYICITISSAEFAERPVRSGGDRRWLSLKPQIWLGPY
jgi:hypothetical protein